MIGNTDGVSVIEMIMDFLACSEVTDTLHCNLCSTQLDRLHFTKHQVDSKNKSNIFQSR